MKTVAAAAALAERGAEVTPVSCSVSATRLSMPYCGTSDGKCGPDHAVYGLFIMFVLVQLTLVLVYWIYFWLLSGKFDTTRWVRVGRGVIYLSALVISIIVSGDSRCSCNSGSYLAFMNSMQRSDATKRVFFGHAAATLVMAIAAAAFDWEAFVLCGASFVVAIKATISITSPQNFGREFAIDVDYSRFQE